MTLRVAVNLTWLRAGQVGGSQEYLVRQLTGLSESAGEKLDVTLFVQSGFATDHPQLAALFDFVEVRVASRGRLARIFLEQTWLALK
ncbi:MAG: hypothetical protein ACKO2E_03405, partial [Actinomycetota bacterium]